MKENIDIQYKQEGYQLIAGLDEAGRGAWAGPLVVAAVIMGDKVISEINDSKQLSEKKREKLFPQVMQDALAYSVVSLTSKEVDQLGVHKANLFALSYALTHLDVVPDIALIDGFAIEHYVPVEQVINGDARSYSIASASILAKVVRDRLMRRYDRTHGGYAFSKHKGYGTKLHREQLAVLGSSPIHRLSYKPVQEYL